jgi:hypothetical protein
LLIAKGYNVRLALTGSRLRRGNVLLHDETGVDWPRDSGLIVPTFQRLNRPCDDAEAQRYYGDEYELLCGRVKLPPLALSKWKFLGSVQGADYERRGYIEPGQKRHEFDQSTFFFNRRGLPKLYGHGRALRLELGPGSEWSWRGFVRP